MMTDQEIETEIQAKGLTAPRVTPADIESNIQSEHYFSAAHGCIGNVEEDASDVSLQALDLLTFCVLVLRNGFTVTGESACASPENFDPEIGMKIARQNAVQKIWPLMGYALKERLYQSAASQKPADLTQQAQAAALDPDPENLSKAVDLLGKAMARLGRLTG